MPNQTPQNGVKILYDPDKRRVSARVGEESAGGVSVVDIPFDWGRNTLVPMAGIGAVGTNEKFRRCGVASRMMQKAVEVSRELGYTVGGVSTGVTNVARRLYTRAGYVYLFAVDRFAKPVEKREPAQPPRDVTVRPYAGGDEQEILDLWRRCYADRDFFGGRTTHVQDWLALRAELLGNDPNSIWVAVRGGRIVGWTEYFYHWGNRENCTLLVEPCADLADIARSLLTRLETSMHAQGLKQFTFYASPPQATIGQALLDAGCQQQRSAVFNVAVFDLTGLLERLAPLYAARLRESAIDAWPECLRIAMGDETGEVQLPDGKPGSRIDLAGPYDTVVRVLCGRVSAWEAYLRGQLRIAGDVDRHDKLAIEAFLGQYPWYHPTRDRW